MGDRPSRCYSHDDASGRNGDGRLPLAEGRGQEAEQGQAGQHAQRERKDRVGARQ